MSQTELEQRIDSYIEKAHRDQCATNNPVEDIFLQRRIYTACFNYHIRGYLTTREKALLLNHFTN